MSFNPFSFKTNVKISAMIKNTLRRYTAMAENMHTVQSKTKGCVCLYKGHFV